LSVTYVMTSTGFVTSSRIARGATFTSFGTSSRQIAVLACARSIRVCPGFCLAPAVTTITSASAQMPTSSEPSTDAIGTNWSPWLRSSTSAATLSLFRS